MVPAMRLVRSSHPLISRAGPKGSAAGNSERRGAVERGRRGPTKAAAPAEAPTLKGSDTMVILAQRWAEVCASTGFTVR
jgi:hypothetical protein